jgi:hypothetical protein
MRLLEGSYEMIDGLSMSGTQYICISIHIQSLDVEDIIDLMASFQRKRILSPESRYACRNGDAGPYPMLVVLKGKSKYVAYRI